MLWFCNLFCESKWLDFILKTFLNVNKLQNAKLEIGKIILVWKKSINQSIITYQN